jgi:hypothetical protein
MLHYCLFHLILVPKEKRRIKNETSPMVRLSFPFKLGKNSIEDL